MLPAAHRTATLQALSAAWMIRHMRRSAGGSDGCSGRCRPWLRCCCACWTQRCAMRRFWKRAARRPARRGQRLVLLASLSAAGSMLFSREAADHAADQRELRRRADRSHDRAHGLRDGAWFELARGLRWIAGAGPRCSGWRYRGDTWGWPRGPRYVLKPGITRLARLTGQPMNSFYLLPQRAWVLRSWDALLVPKPFSRVVMVWGQPVPPPESDERGRAAARCGDDAGALAGCWRKALHQIALESASAGFGV